MVGTESRLVAFRLVSMSLGFTSLEGRFTIPGTICGGQEELGQRRLSKNVIKSGRFKSGNVCKGDFMPLGVRRKYLGRAKLRDGPYSCSICGEKDESLHKFFRGL